MPLPPGFTEISDPATQTSNQSGLPTGFKEITNEPDWGAVVKDAMNEASMGKGSKMRDLMTDPVTQAKILPYLTQTAGGIAPIPMGSTIGYAAGQGLSDAALSSYGKSEEIPSKTNQALKLGGSVLADITALPFAKKKFYGSQIGKAETAAGVPEPIDIPSLPRPAGPNSASASVQDTIDMVRNPDIPKTPVFWKQIKDQVDWLYQRGKDEAMSKIDRIKLANLSDMAQSGLNATVSGRAAPAEAMADSLGAPRAIGQAWKAMPPRVRAGLQFFAPTVGLGGLYDLFKTLGTGGK